MTRPLDQTRRLAKARASAEGNAELAREMKRRGATVGVIALRTGMSASWVQRQTRGVTSDLPRAAGPRAPEWEPRA